MRKTCADCCRKHLAHALVICDEFDDWAEVPGDRHFWRCVGHLGEAESHIRKESKFVADQIRTTRLVLMKEGAGAVRKLNIDLLIDLVCEFVESQAKPPSVLGVEPQDPSDNQ